MSDAYTIQSRPSPPPNRPSALGPGSSSTGKEKNDAVWLDLFWCAVALLGTTLTLNALADLGHGAELWSGKLTMWQSFVLALGVEWVLFKIMRTITWAIKDATKELD